MNAIIAGFIIGCAGVAFLSTGGVVGAVLFTWGLITIVHYGLPLYTGYVGFIETVEDYVESWRVLALNVLGCGVAVLLFTAGSPELQVQAAAIINSRMSVHIIYSFFGAIGCGFIMTTAVNFARQKKYLPLLFGVPLFILSGFPHCIADTVYILAASWELLPGFPQVIFYWIAIVLGNYIGCYAPKFFGIIKKQEK